MTRPLGTSVLMDVLGQAQFDDRAALSDSLDALKILEERLRVLAMTRDDMRLLMMSHQMGAFREILIKHTTKRVQPFGHPYLS